MDKKGIKYGTCFNLLLSICFVVSGMLLFYGLDFITYAFVTDFFTSELSFASSLTISDMRELKEEVKESSVYFFLGLIVLIASSFAFILFSKRFHPQNSVFGLSLLTIFLSVVIYLIWYFIYSKSDSYYLPCALFVFTLFAFLRKNKTLASQFKYAITSCVVFLVFVLTLLSIDGSFLAASQEKPNGSEYENYIHQYNECIDTQNPNDIKWGFLPVQYTCYLKRYLEPEEKLTSAKTRLFDIYYGKPFAYERFVQMKTDYAIIDYNIEEALYLYQSAYEALEKRLEMSSDENYKKTVTKILESNKEDYEKSKKMEFMKFFHVMLNNNIEKMEQNENNIEHSMMRMSDMMIFSLVDNDYSFESYREKSQGGMAFEDIVRYKEEVYNSGKSVLFSGAPEVSTSYVIIYNRYDSLGDLIDKLQ